MIANKINELRNERRKRAMRGGSPYFTYSLGALAAAATAEFTIEKQFPAAVKYQPLDYIEIINNEPSNTIIIGINARQGSAQKSILVPAMTQRISDEDLSIWSVHILNNGAGVTTAGNVVIKLKRKPLTIDEAARLAL